MHPAHRIPAVAVLLAALAACANPHDGTDRGKPESLRTSLSSDRVAGR